jgi:hypothetical protein
MADHLKKALDGEGTVGSESIETFPLAGRLKDL